MKSSTEHRTTWLMAATILLTLLVSLSCCGTGESTNDNPTASSADASASTPTNEPAARPAVMTEALEKGRDENRIVVIELYDVTCEYCTKMDRVLKKKSVINALADLIHVRITPEDEDVIEEFGMTQSPSFLFFKPNGEYMGPYLDGYRSSKRFVAEIENFNLRNQGLAEKELPEDNHPSFGKG